MKIDISFPDELAKALDEYAASGRSPDVLINRLITAHFTGGSYAPDVSGADAVIRLSLLESDLDHVKDQLDRIKKECVDLAADIRGRS